MRLDDDWVAAWFELVGFSNSERAERLSSIAQALRANLIEEGLVTCSDAKGMNWETRRLGHLPVEPQS
jgi:hypothetical protein